jgi:hypothetical protein
MKSMKKVGLLVLIAAIGANLAIVRAHAESEARVAVSIPFDFVVGKNVLKAGSYEVEVLQSGTVDLWSADAGRHYIALLVPGSLSNGQSGDPHLVFTRYGSEAFLSKVAMSVDANYELPISGREKELIHGMAPRQREYLTVQSSQ